MHTDQSTRPATTPEPTEPDALRARLRGMWTGVAPSWAEHAEYVDARGAELAQRTLHLAAPGPGMRVLELACGPGGLGLAAAPLVAPDGEVVLTDVVAEMTAIAGARAAARGLTHVSTRTSDLEDITEPDRSYDVVLCREGLMFAPDPARALREMRRVLRPGGRVAVSVWGPREANPWLGIVFDGVSAQLGRPVPPPGVPGPFTLGDADLLADLVTDAELTDVAIEEFPVPLLASSFDQWWARTSALAGPLAAVLAQMPSGDSRALRDRLEDAIEPYRTPTGLELPGVALLVTARRP